MAKFKYTKAFFQRRELLGYLEQPYLDGFPCCSNEENFRSTVDKSTGMTYNECAPFRTPGYVLYSALVSFYVPFLVTVALYVRIGIALHRRHVSRRDRRRMTLGGERRSKKGTSTVAMMCRVGNDLCTAATAAVVIDRTDIDEQEFDQSATPDKLTGKQALVSCYSTFL